MTLEDLRKHIKPLTWCEFGDGLAAPISHVLSFDFIEKNEDGTWISCYDGESYPNKEEAMRSVEEYHLRNIAKCFNLEDTND